jgi:hypothetical protein
MPGQMWWLSDEDEKVHPDDSMLLAYIRWQLLDKSEPGIRQHIAHCEECQKRCNELRQPSDMLKETLQRNSLPLLQEDVTWDWLQSPEAAQIAYQRRQHERLHEDLALGIALLISLPLVLLTLTAKAVPALLPYVRKLQPVPRRGGNRVMNFAQLMSIPVVAFLVLTLTAILVLAELNSHYPLNPFHSFSSITTTVVQSTVIVPAHATPTPAVVPQSGVTLTPNGSTPTLTECPLNTDKKTHHFGIFAVCGKNFKPNTKVELFVLFGDGSSKTRHPVTVDASGNFEDIWPISSCKDAPTTIIAQNVTLPSVNLGELQNILFGKCSSNLLQKAGTSHH